MHKAFIVTDKDSELYRDYSEYIDIQLKLRGITKRLFKEFNIPEYLRFKLIEQDIYLEDHKVTRRHANRCEKYRGLLKLRRNRDVVSMYRFKAKNIGIDLDRNIEPMVQFYMKSGGLGKVYRKVIKKDDVIYIYISSDKPFETPDYMKEISVLDFYRMVKEIRAKKNNKVK